jgi:phosphomannomutase
LPDARPQTGAGIDPRAVRAYDIRGRVGREIDERGARALGLSYAAVARGRGARRVAVGYDGRLSSPALEAALVDGLVVGGLVVERTGLGPTPLLYHAVHSRGLDGGIQVTGSHNPADENGFKLLLGTEPVHGGALAALVAAPAAPVAGGASERIDLLAGYVDRLLLAAGALPTLRVAWDCGNGATGAVVPALTARLPGSHHLLNAEVDGRFPAHHPDPSVPNNLAQLRAAVVAGACDLGMAFDGDGDRIGVVDGTGAILWPDQLLLLLARDQLRRTPGAAIVADVKSSRVLFDGIAAAGGQALMGPSGYVLVRERMLAERAPLAGEMSGHIFYADGWTGTDDALHVALRLLAALGRSGESLAAFRASLPPTVATPELRLACPDARKAAVLAKVAARLAEAGAVVDRTDGLRVTTGDGWWLLRASGTEPKLTARCEAADEAGLERLKAALFAELRASGMADPD